MISNPFGYSTGADNAPRLRQKLQLHLCAVSLSDPLRLTFISIEPQWHISFICASELLEYGLGLFQMLADAADDILRNAKMIAHPYVTIQAEKKSDPQ